MQLFVRDKAFYRKMLAIALPIALQSVISIGVNIADTVMLGSFGEITISASSLANQYDSIFNVLCLGIGGGASVIAARFWGKRDALALRKVITIMLRVALGMGLLFTLVALLFPAAIMRVFTPNADIIAEGVRYFSLLSWTFVLKGITVPLTSVLRSAGKVRVALLASIASFLSNLLLNWMFIFGHWGAPRLGIVGAALATLISRILEMSVFLFYLFREGDIGYRPRDMLLSTKEHLAPFFRFSIPVIISDLLLVLGESVLSMIMGRISPEFVAANAITMLLLRVCSVFSMGVSASSAALTGNTLGEGRREAAYREGRTFFVLSTLIGVVMGGFIWLVRPLVLTFYNISADTHTIAMQLMLAVALMLPFRMLASALTKGVLRGGGDTRFLMVADILFLWVVSIPLGYLAALVWQLPAFWVYLIFFAEFPLKSILCLFRFHSRKWIQEIG